MADEITAGAGGQSQLNAVNAAFAAAASATGEQLPAAILNLQSSLSSLSQTAKDDLGKVVEKAQTLINVYSNYADIVRGSEGELFKLQLERAKNLAQFQEEAKGLISDVAERSKRYHDLEETYLKREQEIKNKGYHEELDRIKEVEKAHSAANEIESASASKASSEAASKFREVWSDIQAVAQRGLEAAAYAGRAEALGRGAQFAPSAGVGGGATGGTSLMGPDMFAGISPTILTIADRFKLLNDVISSAPRVADTSSDQMIKMVGVLGNFGNSVDDSAKILINASKALNFSAEDVTSVYEHASGASKFLGMHTNETAELMMKMSTSLRAVGADSRTTDQILFGVSQNMVVLGQTLTQVEIKRFSEDLANGLSKLTPDKIAGLLMFTEGGGLPSADRMKEAAANPLQLASEVFNKVEKQFAGQENMQLIAAGPLLNLLSISSGSFKETVAIKEILSQTDKTNEEKMREMQQATKPQEAMIQTGLESLQKMVSPLERMSKSLANIEQVLIGGTIGHVISALPGLIGTIAVARAASEGISTGKAVAGLLGLRAAQATGGALMVEAALPIAAGAAALTSLGWAAYEAKKAYEDYNR